MDKNPRRRKRRSVSLPKLTPRAREVVTLVINAIALGSHDEHGEFGAIADRLGMTRGRLGGLLRRLEGWLTVEDGFVYPTVAALLWQNPEISEKEARAFLRKAKR